MVTHYTQRGLIIICASIWLTGCGDKPSVVSVPPAEWTQPVEEPPAPAETTDESVADYIVSLIDALRASNNKLKRLDEWRAKVSE